MASDNQSEAQVIAPALVALDTKALQMMSPFQSVITLGGCTDSQGSTNGL